MDEQQTTAPGRWLIWKQWDRPAHEANRREWIEGPPTDEPTPCVPCDDAAVERAAEALRNSEWAASITPGRTVADDQSEEWARERVRRIFRAAGEETG